MKIRIKLLIIFSIIIALPIGLISFTSFDSLQKSVIDAEIQNMKNTLDDKNAEIQSLHARASEDIVFALKNPKFIEYFELPETQAGNVYNEQGVLQFTPKQQEIKSELEQWIYHFQNKFKVDETCLIDTSGQEHARLVLTKIAPDNHLSSEEASAPFFEPSFQKNIDQVHVQEPYVSPDTNRWVFAYTSPIVLSDGKKEAIYHFEMPMLVFQDIIQTDVGRMFVVDPQGHLIADSDHHFSTMDTSDIYNDYFPSKESISESSEFEKIVQNMNNGQSGSGTYFRDGQTHYVVYKPLPTFGWSIGYERSYSVMLTGDTSLIDLRNQIIGISLGLGGIGVFSSFFIANKISMPIRKMKRAVTEIENGNLNVSVQEEGDYEFVSLARTFNSMTKSLQKTIDLEKQLVKAEQTIKNEKLAAIGALSARLAHDIRNPLSVIKMSLESIQTNYESNESAKKYFGRVDRAINRIAHQIDDVMGFVRTHPLQRKNHSIVEIFKQTIDGMIIPKTIKIKLPEEDVSLKCDAVQLQVAFVNIITNAIYAMHEIGNITIRIFDKVDNIMIEIEDSGEGIPENILPNIFEPLFTTKQKGTGLGLASTKTIVDQHGGTINAYNNPTRFVIHLPKNVVQEIAHKDE